MDTGSGTFRVGIDVGGTFTDLVAFDTVGREVTVLKASSTPQDPIRGMLNALAKFGADGRVQGIMHGTTIATNAVIQRRGAEVTYVTTWGFRDIPFIQRMNRKTHYDIYWIKPKPLIKRRNTVELDERLDYKGDVLRPLTEEALQRLIDDIRARGPVESIAVCLLFSYVNPDHEQRVRDALRRAFPGVPVSISFEVQPTWKEYERASTTIADAYIKPIVSAYVDRIGSEFDANDITRNVVIMRSNGGIMTLEQTREAAASTMVSGPTGGVIASKFVGGLTGLGSVVSLDMGGTSTDVSTIVDGREHFTTGFEIEWGIPIQLPMIDIRTIGAGGGSIAWIDKGGMLQVGPQSAGADPGPAAYGLGGTDATVTDANLVLGRINPAYFLGGEMGLDRAAAEAAVDRVAADLGLNREQAALSIVRIANNNMIAALREVLIEQGYDPRDFSLVAFGGAGPLHAADLMVEMNIPRAVIPIHPAAFSAFGFLLADARVDTHRTVQMTSRNYDLSRLNDVLNDLRSSSVDSLTRQGFTDDIEVFSSVEMRYHGQNYELEVPVPTRALGEEDLVDLWEAFHAAHERSYGFRIPGETMEIVNLKTTGVSHTAKPSLPKLLEREPAQPHERRPVYFTDRFVETPIYRRQDLASGQQLVGPAVVEEDASTTLVSPGTRLEVDAYGNLLISEEGTVA